MAPETGGLRPFHKAEHFGARHFPYKSRRNHVFIRCVKFSRTLILAADGFG